MRAKKKMLQHFGGGCHLPLGCYFWQPGFFNNKNNKDLNGQKNTPWMIVNGERTKLKNTSNTLTLPFEQCFPHPSSKDQKLKQIKEEFKKNPKVTLFIGIGAERLTHLVGEKVELAKKIMTDEFIKKIPISGPEVVVPITSPKTLSNTQRPLYYLHSHFALEALNRELSHLTAEEKKMSLGYRLWVAGASLHQICSQAGYWIEGDNDLFGQQFFHHWQQSPLGKRYWDQSKKIIGLTRMNPISQGPLDQNDLNNQKDPLRNRNTYRVSFTELSSSYWKKFSECSLFFWTSLSQFEAYSSEFKKRSLTFLPKAIHLCGPGKTADLLPKALLTFYQDQTLELPIIEVVPSVQCFIHFLLNEEALPSVETGVID